MKVKKIYIITGAPIPIGFAVTNRILSYATGFKQNGVDCQIVIFRKTESFDNPANRLNEGIIQNIHFKYLFKSTKKSKYFVKRRIDNFLGAMRLFGFVVRQVNKEDVIIYYSIHNYAAIILFCLKYLKHYILLKEENDHPIVTKRSKSRIGWMVFKKLHYHLFDGLLLMTNQLVSFFSKNYPKKPYVLVPMTVDLTRFENNKVPKGKIITYVGSLNNKKDGIFYLLKAFSKLQKDYKLLICGFSNSKEKDSFLKKVEKYHLSDKIIYKNNISNLEIPNELLKSSLHILPRPKSKIAQYGFPTKLGEYLATGIPVIVTRVGEIPKYLTHKQNAYIINPDDSEDLYKMMNYVIEHYEEAIEVGKNGRRIAEKYFSNIRQTKHIINFINAITGNIN